MSYFFLLCMNVYVRYFILDQKEDTGGKEDPRGSPFFICFNFNVVSSNNKVFYIFRIFFPMFLLLSRDLLCVVVLCFSNKSQKIQPSFCCYVNIYTDTLQK